MNHKAYLGPLLSILFMPHTFSDPPQPAIQFTNFASVVNEPGRTADLNGDGRFDVFTTLFMQPYWNTGSNFLSGARLNYDKNDGLPIPLAFGDFDNDSDLDIFFTRQTESANVRLTTIRWNTGTNSFTNLPSVTFPSLRFGAAAAADYDNDGDLDIVMAGSTNTAGVFGRNVTRFLENFGHGEFRERSHQFPGLEDGTVSWADYDNDGDPDLLLSGYTTNNTAAKTILYRNDAGSFVDSGIALPSLINDTPIPASAFWGDYDNDADLDLLLAGWTLVGGSRESMARIYRNDGDTFSEVLFCQVESGVRIRANWADFDADGDLDIIAQSRIYVNQGDGTFEETKALPDAEGQVYIAFFDPAPGPDIYSVENGLRPRALRNITARTNTPPSAPADLIATQTNNSISFTWAPSIDLEQTSSLTYNLRIGTSPGGSEIMSAMSNPTNGMLYVAQLGNTSLRTNWTIHRLPAGTYYWTVQAIDHGFLGSLFAPEQTITVTASTPVVEGTIQNISSTGALITGRIHPNGALTTYFVEINSPLGNSLTPATELSQSTRRESIYVSVPALESSSEYSVRLVATNSFGVTYGSWLLFSTLLAAPSSEFAVPFHQLGSNRALAVDFDLDGDLDLLNSGVSNSVMGTKLFLNNRGLFTEGNLFADAINQPLRPIHSAADINNDARMDLFFYRDQLTELLLSRPNGTWLHRAITGNVIFGDADNDGDLDFVSERFASEPLYLVLNDGYPNTRTFRFISGAQLGEWGDYDNDGDNDLLLWGFTNNISAEASEAFAEILRNDGSNIFNNAQVELPGTWLDAAWGDYDNDADLDLFLVTGTNTAQYTTTNLELYRNETTNGFVHVRTIVSANSVVEIHCIDFNRDGWLDVFARVDGSSFDQLLLFTNEGGEQFVQQDLGLGRFNILEPAAFGDFDGDKMPDLIVNTVAPGTFSTQARLRFFRNNSVSAGSLPPVPSNLTATVTHASATLRWQIDAGVPANPFTNSYSFNVRIGKTPGGSQIMSAQSHPVTGARYVPQRGNAGQGNTWTIRDLPPATYCWSVQSVDHAFNGSPFSTEGSFTIAPNDRTPRILSIERHDDSHYYVTLDAQIRSRVQLQSSSDLVDWMQVVGQVYIGSEPVVIDLGTAPGEHHFYRFQLLE